MAMGAPPAGVNVRTGKPVRSVHVLSRVRLEHASWRIEHRSSAFRSTGQDIGRAFTRAHSLRCGPQSKPVVLGTEYDCMRASSTSCKLRLVVSSCREHFASIRLFACNATFQTIQTGLTLPKPNYSYAKRQREIAKKQKKEDKRRQKAEAANPPDIEDVQQTPDAGTTPTDPDV